MYLNAHSLQYNVVKCAIFTSRAFLSREAQSFTDVRELVSSNHFHETVDFNESFLSKKMRHPSIKLLAFVLVKCLFSVSCIQMIMLFKYYSFMCFFVLFGCLGDFSSEHQGISVQTYQYQSPNVKIAYTMYCFLICPSNIFYTNTP